MNAEYKMPDTIVMESDIKTPFDFLYDEPWTWFVDNADSDSYYDSDLIYEVLVERSDDKDAALDKYNTEHGTTYTLEELLEEYNRLMNKMIPDVLENIAKSFRNGELEVKYTN